VRSASGSCRADLPPKSFESAFLGGICDGKNPSASNQLFRGAFMRFLFPCPLPARDMPCRKKCFFRLVRNTTFFKSQKGLYLLTKTRFFSQRFIFEKNGVNPTVGFIF
jgi:hypothetical protein